MKNLIRTLVSIVAIKLSIGGFIDCINPNNARTQEVVTSFVYGKNTNFLAGLNAGVWISNGNTTIQGVNVALNSATELSVKFAIPNGSSTGAWDIYVDSVADGKLLFPGAFTVNPAKSKPWIWAKSLGAHSEGQPPFVAPHVSCEGIIVDASGNSYVTGEFEDKAVFGSSIVEGAGLFGGGMAFVAKYDSDGNVLWVKPIITNLGSHGYGLAWDNDQKYIYVTGDFSGTGTIDGILLQTGASRDGFLAKCDENGNWQWIKKFGVDYYAQGFAVACDKLNNVFITGTFKPPFNPATQKYEGPSKFGPFTIVGKGEKDVLFARCDPLSGNFNWVTSYGDVANDVGTSISIYKNGNEQTQRVYIGGYFSGDIFFALGYFLHAGPNPANFIASFDFQPGASIPKWAVALTTDFGSDPNYYPEKRILLSCDSLGNCLATGNIQGETEFEQVMNPKTLISSHISAPDAFVAKYLYQSGKLDWAKSLIGSGQAIATGIAIDSKDQILLTGVFGPGENGSASSISLDGYVLSGSKSSNSYIYVLNHDGKVFSSACALITSNGGNAYVDRIAIAAGYHPIYGGVSFHVAGHFRENIDLGSLHLSQVGVDNNATYPNAFVARYYLALSIKPPF